MSKQSKLWTAEKVVSVTEQWQKTERDRANARRLVNTLFNGEAPYTPEEVERHQIKVNVNWGVGSRIIQDALRQVNDALLHPGLMFTCSTDYGPVEKRDEWGMKLAKNLHIPMQQGRSGKRYHFTTSCRNAQLCLHGTGTILWPKRWDWQARFVPQEDVLMPTETYSDFSNLRAFAVNLYLSPGELIDMTQGELVDSRWNQEKVRAILEHYRSTYEDSSASNASWTDQPEAALEIAKQNRGYLYSDVPEKVKFRAFYYQDIPNDGSDDKPWHRMIVLREAIGNVTTEEFIYNGSDVEFAKDISEFLSVQYADSNIMAPFRYHSTRGLGVPLFAPVDSINRLFCELVQHTSEQMKPWFRVATPSDRARIKQIAIDGLQAVDESVRFVTREERHQIDSNLVETVIQNLRQITQESSSSYIRDFKEQGGEARTAFEVNALVTQANQLVSGMLNGLYMQDAFEKQEYLRRFMDPENNSREVILFRQRCVEDGIPPQMLQAGLWTIKPERVLGGGDQMLAQAQSQWLLQNKMQYGPEAQQKIMRIATSTVLRDPDKANMLVPSAPPTSTPGSRQAEELFGTLMQGVQIELREGVDPQGYIEAMLKMMAGVVQRIQSTDNMGTPDEIIGLQNCAMNVGQYLMLLAQNDAEKQNVRKYADALGQIINEVKGFSQRQQQAMEASAEQGQGDPQAVAKAQSTVMMAQIKAKITQDKAAMTQRHKELGFQLDEARKNMQALAEIKRENVKHQQEMFNASMKGATDNMIALRKQKSMAKSENRA